MLKSITLAGFPAGDAGARSWAEQSCLDEDNPRQQFREVTQ